MKSVNHSARANHHAAKSKDNIRLYYEKNFPKTNKSVLFFLHGLGGDLDAWHFVRDQLAQKGIPSISMDLRGHGYSDHPRAFISYEIDNFVEDIATIMAKEKIKKIILIGHCFGAILALHFAIKYPAKLTKLVVISGSYTSPPCLVGKISKALAVGAANLGALVSPKPYQPRHSEYPVGKFHKDYDWIGLMKTIAHNSLRSYTLILKEIIKLDLGAALKKIKTPTLVIVGEKDSIFPAVISKKIHKKIAGSKFKIIPEANHVVILNNADRVFGAISDFLKLKK
ncbi:MAG: alpha/beta hydrolase [Patescibacteria group bacterium]